MGRVKTAETIAAHNRRCREYTARNIAAGLCIHCSEPAVEGKRQCDKHIAASKISREKRKPKRRERENFKRKLKAIQKKCISCELPIVERGRCEKHLAALNKSKEKLEKYRESRAAYREKNKERIRTYMKAWVKSHGSPPRSAGYNAKRNESRRKRKLSDPAYWIKENLRRRITKAVQDYGHGIKSKKTAELLGCSMDELVAHIESQFANGMHWGNRELWHIDHKRPCSFFDLTDAEQQKACFHYTNLQPLWAKENCSKGNRYEEDPQSKRWRPGEDLSAEDVVTNLNSGMKMVAHSLEDGKICLLPLMLIPPSVDCKAAPR